MDNICIIIDKKELQTLTDEQREILSELLGDITSQLDDIGEDEEDEDNE